MHREIHAHADADGCKHRRTDPQPDLSKAHHGVDQQQRKHHREDRVDACDERTEGHGGHQHHGQQGDDHTAKVVLGELADPLCRQRHAAAERRFEVRCVELFVEVLLGRGRHDLLI